MANPPSTHNRYNLRNQEGSDSSNVDSDSQSENLSFLRSGRSRGTVTFGRIRRNSVNNSSNHSNGISIGFENKEATSLNPGAEAQSSATPVLRTSQALQNNASVPPVRVKYLSPPGIRLSRNEGNGCTCNWRDGQDDSMSSQVNSKIAEMEERERKLKEGEEALKIKEKIVNDKESILNDATDVGLFSSRPWHFLGMSKQQFEEIMDTARNDDIDLDISTTELDTVTNDDMDLSISTTELDTATSDDMDLNIPLTEPSTDSENLNSDIIDSSEGQIQNFEEAEIDGIHVNIPVITLD